MRKLLLILLCSSWTYFATSQNLPRIIVLSTGGTIAGQQPNADKAGYLPGKIPIEELLKNIPSITQKAIVQGEQIASIGSYDKVILESVKNAVNKGIMVVRSSRVVSGKVTTQDIGPFDDSKLGTIVSDNLNPQKARILLMLSLTISKDKNKIQEMFLTY